MKKMEDNDTVVFIVDVKANRHQIKEAVKKLYDTHVAKVNTLIRVHENILNKFTGNAVLIKISWIDLILKFVMLQNISDSSISHQALNTLPPEASINTPGHFFQELAKEKLGISGISKMQKQGCGHALFQDLQKLSQDEWGKILDTMEANMVLEKNLNQALFDLHTLASAHEDPHLTSWIATS
ncbi:hypothetical protein GH733_002429 [Mirounga leonina]|nr:hypothetical protein GH733_002429 [Mirounga leonina]